MRLLLQDQTIVETAARLARITCFLMAIFISTAANCETVEYGALSANEADRPPVMNPDLASRSSEPGRPPSYGPEDAMVLIVVFSDYQCPACRRATQATHQISAEFPGEVRIEVMHLALTSIHAKAEIAAAAAIAAQNQGKFWEMHDLIFQNQRAMDVADLEQHAIALGLDMEQFRADMNDPDVRQRIKDEGRLAGALGAGATPGWSINGKVSRGWGSWVSFRSKVGQELKAAAKLAEQGMSVSEIRQHRAIANMTNSESYALYLAKVLAPLDAE